MSYRFIRVRKLSLPAGAPAQAARRLIDVDTLIAASFGVRNAGD